MSTNKVEDRETVNIQAYLIMRQQRWLICSWLSEVSNHSGNSNLTATISQHTARLQMQDNHLHHCNHNKYAADDDGVF